MPLKMKRKIKGLVAATFSPMNEDGSINTRIIPQITEHLIEHCIEGLYLCGSTGEGPLLSVDERKQIAEAYIQAVNMRIPVIVHVGHDSLAEARSMAQHAAASGTDAIAAVGPCYFKAASIDMLIAYLASIAEGAPDTDFYYYHVPLLSGNVFDMMEFLEKAPSKIPTLKGIKYSALTVHGFQECIETYGDLFQVFFGCDEMLTSGLSVGADSAIGSTYNFAGRLYRGIMDCFAKGDMKTARELQYLSVRMIRVCYKYRGLPAFKSVLKLAGLDCGPTRLPLEALSTEEFNSFKTELEVTGLREWI
jgi:N-acetylneuraminate lyase